MQERTSRADFTGGSVSLFRLPQNLGLSDHHRIETRSHPKKMLHTLQRFVPVEDLEFVLPRSHSTGEKAMRDPLRRDGLWGGGVNFNAITSGEKKGLCTTDFIAQSAVHRRVAREPLPRFHVGSMMTDPDAEQIH
jgi:hypothetical protein